MHTGLVKHFEIAYYNSVHQCNISQLEKGFVLANRGITT